MSRTMFLSQVLEGAIVSSYSSYINYLCQREECVRVVSNAVYEK